MAATHRDINPKTFDIRGTDCGVHDMQTGVITNKWEVNRWQKHGHDRLYFTDHDGYIDIETGEVCDGAPIANVEVEMVGGEAWIVYYMGTKDLDETFEKPVTAIRR